MTKEKNAEEELEDIVRKYIGQCFEAHGFSIQVSQDISGPNGRQALYILGDGVRFGYCSMYHLTKSWGHHYGERVLYMRVSGDPGLQQGHDTVKLLGLYPELLQYEIKDLANPNEFIWLVKIFEHLREIYRITHEYAIKVGD